MNGQETIGGHGNSSNEGKSVKQSYDGSIDGVILSKREVRSPTPRGISLWHMCASLPNGGQFV